VTANNPRDASINALIRYPRALASRIRVARLRFLGLRIGKNCWVRRIRVPRNPWDITLDDAVALDDEVVLLTTGTREPKPRILIGRGTYVNRFTMFDASESITVGFDCLIGPFCYITDHDHGTDPSSLMASQPLVGKPVRIGNNVWIGAGVTILKGVTIGDNAVIGAGAVVTKSIGPGESAAGIPARMIAK
jgi:maltose O-acetyltransferase